MNHQFTVIVDHMPQSNDEILDVADTLGNAGCFDTSIGGHQGGIAAMFNREASSLDAAIKSAITAIENAGLKVTRVEIPRETISLDS